MTSFIVSLLVAGLFMAGEMGPRLGRMAIAGDPPTIYRLVETDEGRSAILAYDRTFSGEATLRWEINGGGRALEVTRDAGRACVVGVRQPAGRRRGNDDTSVWTMTVIDLVTGKATEPMTLGIVPSAVTLLSPQGSEPKLLIATTDRIAAYSLDPPRTSWFYTSPGRNSAIAAGGTGLVGILRGDTLAVIDPGRRPRVAGRLQLTNDDVTSSIKLPGEGVAVAMSDDGAVAAVLHEDRLTLSLIDVAAGRVMKNSALEVASDAAVMRIVRSSETGYRLMVGSVSPVPSMAVIAIDAPEPVVVPPPQATGTEPEPPPETAPPAATPSATPPAPAAQPPAPQPSPPEPGKEEPKPEPDAEPKSEPEPDSAPKGEPMREPDAGQVPEPNPPPPPPEADAVPPPAAPRPTDEAFLSGTISGEMAAAREVRFYGPNNILKLQARVPIGTDGTFRVALPPAGSYRVVITGEPDAHLFTHPEFRVVVVGSEGKGVTGIDFAVRGRLRGAP